MAKDERIALKTIQADVKWTKYYIDLVYKNLREKNFDDAEKWANEISAIWGTIAGGIEDYKNGKAGY